MAKHTKRRASEKHRRGKGSRKYGGKVMDTTGKIVVSGARGTIATVLIDEGLRTMSTDKKVLLFNSLNGLIRTKQGIKAYQIDITNVDNQEPSMKWTDLGSTLGSSVFSFGSAITSGFSDKNKVLSPPERIAQSLRDIYKNAEGNVLTATIVGKQEESAKNIGELYLDVVKQGTKILATRPAVMMFKPSSVEITKNTGEAPIKLQLSNTLENYEFINPLRTMFKIIYGRIRQICRIPTVLVLRGLITYYFYMPEWKINVYTDFHVAQIKIHNMYPHHVMQQR